MKKTLKMADVYAIANILSDLAPKTTGVLGFAIARNLRVCREALTEFFQKRNDLIKQYGEFKSDDEGYVIERSNTEAVKAFEKDLEAYLELEVDIDIMMIKKEDVINSKLTGEEVFQLDYFMINE